MLKLADFMYSFTNPYCFPGFLQVPIYLSAPSIPKVPILCRMERPLPGFVLRGFNCRMELCFVLPELQVVQRLEFLTPNPCWSTDIAPSLYSLYKGTFCATSKTLTEDLDQRLQGNPGGTCASLAFPSGAQPPLFPTPQPRVAVFRDRICFAGFLSHCNCFELWLVLRHIGLTPIDSALWLTNNCHRLCGAIG